MRNGVWRPLSIAVVGGSIGGLTAACLLRDDGHDVTVYERSPAQLEQRGAGIGLLDETARYLIERQGESIDDISVVTNHVRYFHRDNSVVADYRHFYRFSSWNAVYRRLLVHWDLDRYQLGHEMTGFASSEPGRSEPASSEIESSEPERATTVAVSFANGTSVDVDLLVCADGTGSTARALVAPNAQFGYSGYVAWRGVVPEADFEPATRTRLLEAINYYVYANSHILVYPIPGPDGSVQPGERLINFVWYRNYMDGPELDELMGSQDSSGTVAGGSPRLSIPPGGVADHHVAELKAHATARLPALLADVVVRTEEPFLQVVYDVEVEAMVAESTAGPACLLGDAATVARPHAAAGTAKAADDGWALAGALRDNDDVQAALAAWEPERLELGRSLVERARSVGSRSQVYNNWRREDPDVIFSLHPAEKGFTT